MGSLPLKLTGRKEMSMKRYMITFPSVSAAAYAREKLKKSGFYSTLGKSPAGMLQTCGYALYLDMPDIRRAEAALEQAMIRPGGIYRIQPGAYEKIR